MLRNVIIASPELETTGMQEHVFGCVHRKYITRH